MSTSFVMYRLAQACWSLIGMKISRLTSGHFWKPVSTPHHLSRGARTSLSGADETILKGPVVQG